MFVEEYHKSAGGRSYFTANYRYGAILVSVTDIKAKSKEDAKEIAKKYLKKALEE